MNIILALFTEKQKNTKEADRIMNKYPDRIPIIVSRNIKSRNTPELDKYKYLVPMDLTIGQFMYVIRKRLQLNPEKALFIFINQTIACNSTIVSQAYNESRDPDDGFLHVVYSCENTFG
jgi:GABA(A) receptor-associated protein